MSEVEGKLWQAARIQESEDRHEYDHGACIGALGGLGSRSSGRERPFRAQEHIAFMLIWFEIELSAYTFLKTLKTEVAYYDVHIIWNETGPNNDMHAQVQHPYIPIP